ncbi:MAG: site-specific integrase [Firmicutes bacterium]|nr:site-specific integrase [Bacillota bacterium]
MNDILKPKTYIEYKIYNITQIKKKYGYRIVLIFNDESSQTIQKAGFKTLREANEARNETIAQLHNGTFVLNSVISTEEYFKSWLKDEMKPRIAHNSYQAYYNIIYNYIVPKIGKIKINELNRAHIQELYNFIASKSHSIARLTKCVIKTGLKDALKYKLIGTNIAKDIELPKQVKSKKYRTIEISTEHTLSADQVKVLIESCKDSPIYLEILFAVLMGLRRSEIKGLKFDDIDIINRRIKIQRQLGRAANTSTDDLEKGTVTKQEIPVKSYSSNRELEIPDILFEEILKKRKQYEKNKRRRINDQTTPFKDLNYICCSTYGNPRSMSFDYVYWKEILKKNNLPDIRFHDLRATYCTLLVNEKFNLKAISKMMGHASEIISVDVYTEKSKIVNDCLEELEPFIESVIPNQEDPKEINEEVLDNIENIIDELI